MVLVLALNAAIVGIMAFAVWSWFFGGERSYYTVGDYDLEQGRLIKIVGQKGSHSGAVNLRYEVTQNGKVLVSRDDEGTQFHASASPNGTKEAREFTVVPASQGDLVGITDRNQRDDIVILHDFLTNRSWPASGKTDAEKLATGRELLLRLQREYPFFSSSTLSLYRPQWVWSPRLTHWLVTFPDTASRHNSPASPRLALRVFDTRSRASCLIQTSFDCELFDENAAIGWLGNDVVVLAFTANKIFAWKLADDARLAALPHPLDDAVRARAGQLLNSPRPRDQFAIPSPFFVFPVETAPMTNEAPTSPNRGSPPSAPEQSPGSAR
jgi:hypothetical protein